MHKTCPFLLALMACSACADRSESEDEAIEIAFMDGTIKSDWLPLSASELYDGKTLAEWGVEYTRWSYAQTSCDSPASDQDGSLCDLYQDPESPVFFLDYSPTKRVRTKCQIPRGRAIVVPIMTFSSDNAGVEPPRPEEPMTFSSREKATYTILPTLNLTRPWMRCSSVLGSESAKRRTSSIVTISAIRCSTCPVHLGYIRQSSRRARRMANPWAAG
jgi:hypothetical protein